MPQLRRLAEFFPRLYLHFLAVCALAFIAAAVVWFAFPAQRPILTRENDVVQNLSVAVHLLGLLLSLIVLYRRRWLSYSRTFLFVPLLCLIGALDEISFGQQLLEFEEPKVLHVKVDAVHDMVYVGWKFFTRGRSRKLAALGLVVLGAMVVWGLIRHYRVRPLHMLRHTPPVAYLASAVVFLVPALYIDMFRAPKWSLSVVEEVSELCIAIALLFGAWAVATQSKAEQAQFLAAADQVRSRRRARSAGAVPPAPETIAAEKSAPTDAAKS